MAKRGRKSKRFFKSSRRITRGGGASRGREAAAEYRFKIDAYSPDTMPMSRLAEYMSELSQMLGEKSSVHFERLEKGSTIIVHKVDREAVPKVRARVAAVKQDEGLTTDAAKAFRTINRMLRDDNAKGQWQDNKTGAVIIQFPGRDQTEEKFAAIRQQGSLDGIVTGIRGKDETIHVTIQAEGQQISGCYTTKAIAKQLGTKLFEPVRLFGRGRWARDSEGVWSLLDFKIENFEALTDVSLSKALAGLREIPTEWDDGSLKELGTIRDGPGGKRNGGH